MQHERKVARHDLFARHHRQQQAVAFLRFAAGQDVAASLRRKCNVPDSTGVDQEGRLGEFFTASLGTNTFRFTHVIAGPTRNPWMPDRVRHDKLNSIASGPTARDQEA